MKTNYLRDYLKEHYDGKLFRYWLRKVNYTPYEWDKKFPDQSYLENDECSYGYIVDVIDLGYDYLLGITEDSKEKDYVSFHRLSEIDLAYSESDQEEV